MHSTLKTTGLKASLILSIRNIVMILMGVSGLLLKRWVSSTISQIAYSYWGNITASFAVYFLVNNAAQNRVKGFIIGLISLAIVQSFELTNGFGVMTNVYDPFDYLANALGISLAYVVDAISTRMILARKSR